MEKIRLNLVFMGISRQNLSDNIQTPSIYIPMDGKMREAATIAMDYAKVETMNPSQKAMQVARNCAEVVMLHIVY